MHQHSRRRSGDFFYPLLIRSSVVEAPLHGGQRRLGVDQPDLDLFIDGVGNLALCRAAAPGFAGAARFRRLGLELRDRLLGRFNIGMVIGVFEQHTVEVTVKLLQALVERPQAAAGDDDLRRAVNADHRRDCRQLLLQRVPLRGTVC